MKNLVKFSGVRQKWWKLMEILSVCNSLNTSGGASPNTFYYYYHHGVGVNDVSDDVNDVDGGVDGDDHHHLLSQHPQHAWN